MIVRIQSNSWFLINQIDHAHLAEELARQWKYSDWLDIVDKELLATIRRHDDGWEDWEGVWHNFPNWREEEAQTDPWDPDTDDDGMSDGFEADN